jgi:uncharacterized protein (DUF362 family)/Pyruvate/2-oxoacid:ferredoxin oxidoreductase delta subunit
MTTVFIRQAEYDEKRLKPVIFEMMKDILPTDAIRRGMRVLIKPNLLLPAGPDKAILTHPLVVKAVSEYILEHGGTVKISDSPATGTFRRVIEQGGYQAALKDLPVDISEFKESVKVNIGRPFGEIDVAADAVNADMIINLAKLKTHVQMRLTLGIKNTFGCIVGLRKPEWHFRSGVDRDLFARLLVQIHYTVKPALTIVDGIVALEGQGPGKSGTPRHMGLLVGSSDAFATDKAICHILGLDPERLPVLKAAVEQGLGSDMVKIEGDAPAVTRFKLPDGGPLVFGPRLFHGIMRRHLVQRPQTIRGACRLCGECGKLCPADAITQNDKKIVFNYNACIRCYCCVEVCPHGALHAVETIPGRLFRKVLKLNGR